MLSPGCNFIGNDVYNRSFNPSYSSASSLSNPWVHRTRNASFQTRYRIWVCSDPILLCMPLTRIYRYRAYNQLCLCVYFLLTLIKFFKFVLHLERCSGSEGASSLAGLFKIRKLAPTLHIFIRDGAFYFLLIFRKYSYQIVCDKMSDDLCTL